MSETIDHLYFCESCGRRDGCEPDCRYYNPRREPTYKARRIAQAIQFNVDEFYLDVVTYERFSARQVRLWKRAELAGVVERVTVLVRPKMGGVSR